MTQSVKIKAPLIDLWRMSHFLESAGRDMVAFNVDTMVGLCHGGIRSWPWSDPSLMGLGDEGPGSEGGQEGSEGDLRPINDELIIK